MTSSGIKSFLVKSPQRAQVQPVGPLAGVSATGAAPVPAAEPVPFSRDVMRSISAPAEKSAENIDHRSPFTRNGTFSSPPPPTPHLNRYVNTSGGDEIVYPGGKGLNQSLDAESKIWVHDDSSAEKTNIFFGSNAFTFGSHIFLSRSHALEKQSRLLDHEFVHTEQQTGLQPRVQFDLTPEQREYIRQIIESSTETELEQFLRWVEQQPDRNNLTGDALGAYEDISSALRSAEQNLQSCNGDHCDFRRTYLSVFRREFENNKVFMYHAFSTHQDIAEVITEIGNPSSPLSEEDVQSLQGDIQVMNQGGDAPSRYVFQGAITNEVLGRLHISREEYFTESEEESIGGSGNESETETDEGGEELEEQSDDADAELEGSGDPDTEEESGPPPVTEESRARAEELIRQLASEHGTGTDPVDMDELARSMDGMTEDEIQEFMDLFGSQVASEDQEGRSIEESVNEFRELDEVQREILRTNRELSDEVPEDGTQLTEEIRLQFEYSTSDTQSNIDDVHRLNTALDMIRAVVSDPQRRQALLSLGELSPFFNEMMMFEGLLAGASQQSEEIRDVSVELLNTIADFRHYLLEEIAFIMGELIATEVIAYLLAPVTAGGSAAAGTVRGAVLLRRLNNLRRMIQRIMQIYNTYERIRGILDSIGRARETYQEFQQRYQASIERYEELQRRLDDINTEEDVEDELAQLGDQLYSEIEVQLGQQMGVILETFYIPADAGPEELTEILFNIPRGIETLESLMTYYNDNRDREGSDFTEVLAIRAFRAGVLLYPVVGYLAAVGTEELAEASSELGTNVSIDERAERFLERLGDRGSRRSRRNRDEERERNRGFFRRDRMEYDPIEIQSVLAEGIQWLREHIREDEPSGHWAYPWFRYVMRRKIRDLRRAFRSRRVRGRVRNESGASWQQVPLPPFRLDWPLIQTGRNLEVGIELNPQQDLEVDSLDYSDFSGSGVRYSGSGVDSKKKDALERWLVDNDYQVNQDRNSDDYIRRRGASFSDYLYLDSSGYIRQGLDSNFISNWQRRYEGTLINQTDDLPEGYYLSPRNGIEYVRRKSGINRRYPRLGRDTNGRLVEGRGDPQPRTVRAAGLQEPQPSHQQPYTWQGSLDAMFNEDGTTARGYNTENHDRVWWEQRFNSNADLQARPTRVEGDLGYMVNARSLSDLLSGVRLPEMKTSDDKGHMVAKRFHGTDNAGNLVPQKKTVNRWPGRWYSLENDWSQVYIGNDAEPDHYVHVDVDINYDGDDTRRPRDFTGWWEEREPSGTRVGRRRNIRRISNQ